MVEPVFRFITGALRMGYWLDQLLGDKIGALRMGNWLN